MIFKIFNFGFKFKKIKHLEEELKCSIFQSQNETEDEIIKIAIAESTTATVIFMSLCTLTITSWAVIPFFNEEFTLPFATWYPFSTSHPVVLGIIFIYQIIGVILSAIYNISMDTAATGLIISLNAQVQRVSLKLSKIGYDEPTFEEKRHSIKDEEFLKIEKERREIEKTKNKNYADLIYCFKIFQKIIQ